MNTRLGRKPTPTHNSTQKVHAPKRGCASYLMCFMEEKAMKYLMSAEWWKAAGIRAAKTMFQTGAALVVTQMPGGTVDWMAVGSAVIVAGVASLGTSLAGLPELEKQ